MKAYFYFLKSNLKQWHFKHVAKSLMNHLTENELRHNLQSAFREGHSTETALRLPFTLSGVFSFSYVNSLIRIGHPQTYISMESL